MKDRLGQLQLRFAELRLARDGDRVQVYAGKDFSGYEVSVAVLAEPAVTDQELRRAFAEAAGRARTTGGPGTQSDVHAAVPWLAARHPDGQAAIQRFVAEVDRHRPAMPAGTVALAPLPFDAPAPPVRPDPTFAPTPPPVDLRPAGEPAPPVPAAPPRRVPPAPRPVPAQRPAGPSQQRPRVPVRPAKRTITPATIMTFVVCVLVVTLCCGALVDNLLG